MLATGPGVPVQRRPMHRQGFLATGGVPYGNYAAADKVPPKPGMLYVVTLDMKVL